jgi:hypothetical protein
VTLEPCDYWKLRAVSADLERDQVALAAAQARIELARQRRHALWTETATKYGLDPVKSYTANDDECSLVEA